MVLLVTSQKSIYKKKKKVKIIHLKPKFLLRFSPGSMRKETEGSKLDPFAAFNMDRIDSTIIILKQV